MSSQRQDFGYSRTVSYENGNHFKVIFQRWGSVNHKVMPFCLANVMVALILVYLLEHGIDLTTSEFGHEFMSVLVSFLLLNKLSFTLGHSEEQYRKWRFDVAQQVLTLLKVTVLVVYKNGPGKVWEIPELADDAPILSMGGSSAYGDVSAGIFSQEANLRKIRIGPLRRKKAPEEVYVFGHDLQSDRNLRTPICVAQRVREAIVAHRSLPGDPIDTIREQMLLNCVKEFMDSYYGVRKYLTCPLPLPLVQLGRVFVLFYIFTMPAALLSPSLNLKYIQMVVLIFLMTYGFVGIELLFVELDDPFREDPNDLPLTEEARAAGEDVVLALWHADGKEVAERLRDKFLGQRALQGNTSSKETDPLVRE
ncbi:expressed unknown protein [Seminavis robusta]|uniref:Uncharacterized protein n=1 Tax=Seminavis robusta TaxID=568900 RepID=A0A9N8EA57_9STRA|nr:expressed unknown protein [Seminavis robusta]|eukprot:Sro798_g204020.1 n/a (365) ;mRNA; r:37909-39194